MKFESLRFKINFAILLTFTIIALFCGAVLYPIEVNRRQSRLENIEILLSAVFQQKKEELANEIFADQKAALLDSLNEIRKVKGIEALNVFNLDGELLLSTETAPGTALSKTEMKTLAYAPSFSKAILHGRPVAIYSTIVEVIGERVGFLKIYFDLSDMEKETFQNRLFFYGLMFFSLLIMALLLNILLSRSVIQPALMLRNAIMKVQNGYLGEQVHLVSKDEIGEMGSAFNDMSAKLKEQHIALLNAIDTQESYALKLEETNKKLEDLNIRLEDIVNERTAELRKSNEQLQQEINERLRADKEKKSLEERLARSQKMEALGLLAGGVAHDLNNVLSGMVSYPDLLLMDLPEGSPLRKPILTIRDSGLKAAAIVQDLLTLARRGVTNPKVLNLNDKIVSDYLRSPEHKKIKAHHPSVDIEVHLEPDLLNIRGSEVHLKKTLMNLISNAAEAQPKGGIIIISTRNQYVDRSIKGYDEVSEGDFVVLKVEDNGIGIAPDDLSRIFEPFYTKKVMGRSGTGLGMAVVWGTMQDHNGYIDVKSTEGKGTVFELYFPVTREEVSKGKSIIHIEELVGTGETVLVVDDVEEQREISSNILTKLGYSVTTVASGEEAVEYLKNNATDVLVLDMIMDPGMDGLDTYKNILKLYPDQKAIIASGYAESERVKEAQKLGAGAYIKKPYTLEKIGLTIKNELSK